MKKVLVIITMVVLNALYSMAQEPKTITLPMLYNAIEQNNPISEIKPIIDSVTILQTKNINATFYPKVNVNASASWQSDVTELNIPVPGITIPTPDHDQYRLSFDIAQIIWDGGNSSAHKELTHAQAEVDKSSIQNELYALRDKVCEVFFSIILIDITHEQLSLMKEELEAKHQSMVAGVNEGVILPSATSSLKAEIIRLDQKMMELPSRKKSLISLLESLTGMDLTISDEFSPPNFNDSNKKVLNRPELLGFSSQKSLFDARINLVSKRSMPIISAFVTSGYGKPGLNMLSNEWNPFVMAGAKFSWNIWDWNTTQREREQLTIQKKVIDLRKQTFEQSINSAVESTENQIEILTKQISLDNVIVELLQEVKRKSESQLSSGVISSTEYLSDFNDAARAKLDMKLRKVLLIQEKAKLYYLLGLKI